MRVSFLLALTLVCMWAVVDAAPAACKEYKATLWLGDKSCKTTKSVKPIKIKEKLKIGNNDSCNDVSISGIKGSVRIEKDGKNLKSKIFLGPGCGGANGKPTVLKKGIVEGKCAGGFKVLGRDASVTLDCV